MTVQRRPLTGMISSGVAAPRAINNAAPTVLHQVSTSAVQAGGPFTDVITLYVQNPTAGGIDVTITPLGGSAIVQTIASKSVAAIVLDQVPMQCSSTSSGTGTQILGQGASAGLVFWGWFARPL